MVVGVKESARKTGVNAMKVSFACCCMMTNSWLCLNMSVSHCCFNRAESKIVEFPFESS